LHWHGHSLGAVSLLVHGVFGDVLQPPSMHRIAPRHGIDGSVGAGVGSGVGSRVGSSVGSSVGHSTHTPAEQVPGKLAPNVVHAVPSSTFL
jgi:hypothetical protein